MKGIINKQQRMNCPLEERVLLTIRARCSNIKPERHSQPLIPEKVGVLQSANQMPLRCQPSHTGMVESRIKQSTIAQSLGWLDPRWERLCTKTLETSTTECQRLSAVPRPTLGSRLPASCLKAVSRLLSNGRG